MSKPTGSANETSWKNLIKILKGRRSRRFGLGMEMESGPMAYKSRHEGLPLTEEEEALLAYAACGITGHALGDLVYDRGQGGTIMAGLSGRTIPSGDAIQTCSLIVMNSEGAYYIKRPQDVAPAQVKAWITLAEQEDYRELYRQSRVQILEGRSHPPLEPFFNINCNKWSLYDPNATYFLPVEDFTMMYINALLEIFNEHNGIYPLDERAGFRPAGIKKFAKSRGGHLEDDPRKEHVITIQQLETLVTEFVTAESGMIIQNMALMTQAMGLGGFPHWAAHYYGWFKALGFKMKEVRASRFLGMGWLYRLMARLLQRDTTVPFVLGLETEDEVLIKPFCPPNYATMEDAVHAVVDMKWGSQGIFGEGARQGVWQDPDKISRAAPEPSDATIEATIAYCNYIYNRYGRFPAYQMPLRTLLGYQVNHVDVEFYDRFYRPEALTDLQRQHVEHWHDQDL
ncbi:hypothetical protein NC796_12505 [Aliifodinibius sp. S!AR15-10]|uniref:hypothetical protein n=1 Tax=Aliifodinibius sp. S!AR15-10 TaxID=2950437 RepID=UPI002858448A|nr:hypothetical protein [Aliifodinibius sp. S!AR15-10]MDR8391971.1 hypothetical protein [Aliifodinibius sp. S!AR15-10]